MFGVGGRVLSMLAVSCILCFSSAVEVTYDARSLLIDGERKIIVSGAIHYPRSTPDMWPDLIRKAKEGGLDAIETYVFWNAHEPRRRHYNFEENLDLIRFLKEIRSAGLYSILRIGPYVCAEWNYGGLPVWLHQVPGVVMRTDNPQFKEEMENFTTLIINMIKQEKLLAPQGGPIILTQIENEYGNGEIGEKYGEPGRRYLQWCAKMAQSQDTGIPWIMCQQDDAPRPMINTHNGFYLDNFVPNNPNSPKIWTENWSGWFQSWGMGHLHRPVEDLAYSAAIFFQSNGSLLNYYMYHGGTNFGRTSGGPYVTTSYDFDAPLDEYGNLRQPKWGHLKDLHDAIKSMEKALLHGQSNTTKMGNGTFATKYSVDGTVPGCFLVNINSSSEMAVNFEGKQYFLPAKSVSVLPDCRQEVYNTAKINEHTSYIVTKPNEGKEKPSQLDWSWRSEDLREASSGMGNNYSANGLLEQIKVTGDDSDYLWYMTSVNKDGKEEDQMTLRVATHGHILHVFINGDLQESHYPRAGEWPYVLEQEVHVKPGNNQIALLSATVGLKNYGAFFDMNLTGIAGGPVQLIGNNNVTKDLTSNRWSYKTGLNGVDREFYGNKAHQPYKWKSDVLPVKRPFTWYKASFDVPLGNEPVVVDLKGMGKGEAWVNGKSIGRFWPSNIATEGYGVRCGRCDYRDDLNTGYVPCQSGCGGSSQRRYHVPRYFLNPGTANTVVLFEEMGGNPTDVSFQTVGVGSICGVVAQGRTLRLSCQGGGRTISALPFCSFGNPQGRCGLLETGQFGKATCESAGALSVVQKACVGRSSCSIEASESNLGWTGCGPSVKRLAVQAICG